MNIYPNKDCWRSLFFKVIDDFINAVGYFSILGFFSWNVGLLDTGNELDECKK